MMTKAEAVKWLESLKQEIGKTKNCSLWHYAEAIDMVIEVMSEPKTGEWDICKDADGVYGVCSICGCYADFSIYGRPYKVCPHCGARMRI